MKKWAADHAEHLVIAGLILLLAGLITLAVLGEAAARDACEGDGGRYECKTTTSTVVVVTPSGQPATGTGTSTECECRR